jgi:uncharacterized protein (TIGR04255 family)
MVRIPLKLKVDPILEAVAEIRFAAPPSDIGAVLPGLLLAELSDLVAKHSRLPASEIPPHMRQNGDLRYVPLHQLSGERAAIQVADRALGISTLGNYPGWAIFKPMAIRVFEVAAKRNLFGRIERISVKYVNLLEATDGASQLALTHLKLEIGDWKFETNPVQLRVELKKENLVGIVQLSSLYTAANESNRAERHGLVVDVDVICNGPFDSGLKDIDKALDVAHSFEKELFYELVKPEVVERYEPEY